MGITWGAGEKEDGGERVNNKNEVMESQIE